LRSLFRQVMAQLGYEYDGKWDWTLKKEGLDDLLKALRN